MIDDVSGHPKTGLAMKEGVCDPGCSCGGGQYTRGYDDDGVHYAFTCIRGSLVSNSRRVADCGKMMVAVTGTCACDCGVACVAAPPVVFVWNVYPAAIGLLPDIGVRGC